MKPIRKIIKRLFADESGFFIDYCIAKQPYSMYSNSMKKYVSTLNIKLPPDYVKEIKDFWKSNFGLNVKPYGYRTYYAFNGIRNANYIPEDIFLKFIVRKLNNFALAKAYADKNIYNKLFPNVQTPKTVIRNMNGRFFDEDYNYISDEEAADTVIKAMNVDKVIIKPSIYSGGGHNITLLDMEKLDCSQTALREKIANILFTRPKDYIVQYFFHQHDLLNDIHPSSVNTMRIVTFENHGEIGILAHYLRIGNDNSFVDNISSGGLSCGINREGYLNEFALGKDVRKRIYVHPNSKFIFKGKKIPNFDTVLDTVKLMHRQISPYFRIVSWDVSMTKEGQPTLIEANLRDQGTTGVQLSCGPIFGESTKEILTEILNSGSEK